MFFLVDAWKATICEIPGAVVLGRDDLEMERQVCLKVNGRAREAILSWVVLLGKCGNVATHKKDKIKFTETSKRGEIL